MPHIHPAIDFTVEVFIVHKERVLLRKHDKYGIWLSIGGHVELDEDPNEAAVREVKEEVGLDIQLADSLRPNIATTDTYKELIPPVFMNRHRINATHEHVGMIFFAKSDTMIVTNLESEKSEDIRWFTKEELDDLDLVPQVRHYALQALAILSH